MSAAIVSLRLLSGMTGFFPLLVTIQAKAGTDDPYGQPVETWADVNGWQEIKAAKASLSAMERQTAGYTATDRVWDILLMGPYPDITTAHRVVIDVEFFDIDGVETDQSGNVTRLRVRQATI